MSTRLRIATFNLESLDEPRTPEAADLTERAAVLRPQLLRLQADVLCLQEVNGQRQGPGKRRVLRALDVLLEGTPYAAFHRVYSGSQSRGGVRDRHNLVTLSRFPVADHRQLRHDLVAPPVYRLVAPSDADRGEGREEGMALAVEWDRPILHTSLRLPTGAPLHVVNVHLRAPRAAWIPGAKETTVRWRSMAGWAEGMFLAAIKRAGQAFEARLFLETLFDGDARALVAVCGDFNADLYQTPVRTIRGDEEDMGSPHLVARTLVPLERSLPASQRFSVVHHGRPQMLDHVLVSRPLLAWYRHAEIHNEALGDELIGAHMLPGGPESYHAPVVCEFEMPDG